MKNSLFMRGFKPAINQFLIRLRINRMVAIRLFYHELVIRFTLSKKKSDLQFDKIHNIIECYLNATGYKNKLIENLKIASPKRKDNCEPAPIWICWWQGEDKMPEIVNTCYDRICNLSGIHPVHLVTIDNYQEYVSINPDIIQKFHNKRLMPAHLADLLRLKLLDLYGGLWLDATIYLSRPIDEKVFNYEFYSLKNDCIDHKSVSYYRWCSFVLGCKKGNALVHSLAVSFENYILTEKEFIHYLVIDYFIDMLYKNDNETKELLDRIPYGGKYMHVLRTMYSQPFNINIYNEMMEDTKFFKLTYKGNIDKRTQNGEETFYSVIINQ